MWEPQNNTVLVRKDAPKEVTEGGIVLPTAQIELTLTGEVVSAASGHSFLVGKKVLFSKFSGSEVKVGTENLLIMRAEDVLAIWHDDTLQQV